MTYFSSGISLFHYLQYLPRYTYNYIDTRYEGNYIGIYVLHLSIRDVHGFKNIALLVYSIQPSQRSSMRGMAWRGIE